MSELTEDQKLVKLGLRSQNQTQSAGSEVIAKLKEQIAQEWAAFQENFEDANLGSFADFETWLVDNGFGETTAANIRAKFEDKYSSWSEYETTIIDDFGSWEDFENDFAANSGLRSTRQTDNGLSAAGIKVYEESGVGRSGQSIPAGGVEVYGKEVHFSQTASVQDTKDESAGSENPIVWKNLVVDPNSGRVGDIIDVSAEVENNTNFAGSAVAELIVDGQVKRTKTVDLPGAGTYSVSFDYTAGEDGTGTFDVGISKTGTEEVQVIYGGL